MGSLGLDLGGGELRSLEKCSGPGANCQRGIVWLGRGFPGSWPPLRCFPGGWASPSWCKCLLLLPHGPCVGKPAWFRTSRSRTTKWLRPDVGQRSEAVLQGGCPHIGAAAVGDIVAEAAHIVGVVGAHTVGVGVVGGGKLKQDRRGPEAQGPWGSGPRSRTGRCQGEPRCRWQGSGQQARRQARRWQGQRLPTGRSMLPRSTSGQEKEVARAFRAVFATEDPGLGMLSPGGSL